MRAVNTRNLRPRKYHRLMARPKKYDHERVTTAIRMSEDLQRRLRTAADERDISVNLLAVKAITDYLDHLVPTEEILQVRRSA